MEIWSEKKLSFALTHSEDIVKISETVERLNNIWAPYKIKSNLIFSTARLKVNMMI